MTQAHAIDSTRPTWVVCAAGALGLAVAMGIGRFAFTPLLPLMQREGLLNADGGALLAAANYLGYLLGALTAASVPARPRTLVLGSLLGTAGLTAAAGLVASLPAWLLLRFTAGIVSAWTLVGVSGWTVSTLAKRGRADAGGWVFAGVGSGIALAGLWVWGLAPSGTSALWLQLGVLSMALAGVVALLWRSGGSAATPQAAAAKSGAQTTQGSGPVVLCYAILGFGYILPATYLPALARQLIDDPRSFGLIWPVFGLAAAASTLLAGRALRRWHRLRIWSASHALMALGCALPLLTRSGLGLALAALAVGGTFMVATMVGLQQARSLAPANPTPLLGRMSAGFAAGQIAGPLVALGLDRLPLPGWSGIEQTLLLGALALLGSALWLYRSIPDLEMLDEQHPTPRPG